MLTDRVAMLRETVALVSEMRVEDRLRARLHQLADGFGVATVEGIELRLDLTHAQWASLVGASREAVTTAFSKLRGAGRWRCRAVPSRSRGRSCARARRLSASPPPTTSRVRFPLVCVAAALLAGAGAATAAAAREAVLGRSAEGRPVLLSRVGDAGAPLRVLVVGAVHGNEPAGRAVVRELRRGAAPPGAELWLIHDLNPDGAAAGTRQNARGVTSTATSPIAGARRGAPSTSITPARDPSPSPSRAWRRG